MTKAAFWTKAQSLVLFAFPLPFHLPFTLQRDKTCGGNYFDIPELLQFRSQILLQIVYFRSFASNHLLQIIYFRSFTSVQSEVDFLFAFLAFLSSFICHLHFKVTRRALKIIQIFSVHLLQIIYFRSFTSDRLLQIILKQILTCFFAFPHIFHLPFTLQRSELKILTASNQ